jgi:hypothetical protein
LFWPLVKTKKSSSAKESVKTSSDVGSHSPLN